MGRVIGLKGRERMREIASEIKEKKGGGAVSESV